MSFGVDKLADSIYSSLEERDRRKPKDYDFKAEVSRIDGDTVWCIFQGATEETPVKMTTNARVGDSVIVRVSGRRAWLLGNSTNPPTDDFQANQAHIRADGAHKLAEVAIEDANRAKEAADRAEADAERANVSANQAQQSATIANTAANGALSQLGVVEDVVGTLNWITEHGTYIASEDTEVVPGKYYFTRSGNTYNVVINPTGDPSAQGYYELDSVDEAVSNYVASHLALTDSGLWVTKDNSSYKILLSSTGMEVYDAQGNRVSLFGQSIDFRSGKPQYIGGDNAYIVFNPQNGGSITIGGNVTLGSDKTLDEVLAELSNTFIFDTTYQITNGIASFEAHLYQGGTDIKNQYDPEQFTWYLKTEDGEQPIIPTGRNDNSGYTTQVDVNSCGYGAEVIAHFTVVDDSEALTEDGSNLTDVDDIPYTVRATGDHVRVRDLEVSTVIYPSEKLMVVGAEDEHLVTIDDMAEAFWLNHAVTIEEQPLNRGNNNYEDIGLLKITNLEMDSIFVL